MGNEAFRVVADAYEGLDEGGRHVALDVIDHAPCVISASVYVRALVSRYPAHQRHASTRLRRCGAESAGVLVRALGAARAGQRALIADHLAMIAPAHAIEVILPLLAKSKAERRRDLRVVLARASTSSRGRKAILAALGNRSLAEVAAVDLLRALGDRISSFRPDASRAFARLAKPSAAFRTRYLLLEPAAALAREDSSARAYLRRALVADPSPYIRAQAARVVRDPTMLKTELLRAVSDPGVRVREAALETLSQPSGAFAAQAIMGRLRADPWPLVRAAAAGSLAKLGRSRSYDQALFEALGDASPHVRAPVLRALGHRRAKQHAPAIRAILADSDEMLTVRIAAAESLGRMCDAGAVDLLTKYARLLADPMGAGELRVLAPPALRALSRLKPPDLADRLGPLLGKDSPTLTRQAARAALTRRGSCGRR
jgi:HEAT repeat protein